MKTSITLSLFASFLPTLIVLGQCTSTIPANAVVITSSTAGVHGQSNTNFWVCNEAFQQIFTGTNNTFWIEPQAFFNSINGNNNIIHYKGNVALGVFGSNNTIYATSTAAISDQGSGNTINVCGSNGVVFNYNNAPTGCAVVGIGETEEIPFTIHYDLANDVLVVEDPIKRLREIQILDPSGRGVGQLSIGDESFISMSSYPAGLYIVRMITKDDMRSYRFVK